MPTYDVVITGKYGLNQRLVTCRYKTDWKKVLKEAISRDIFVDYPSDIIEKIESSVDNSSCYDNDYDWGVTHSVPETDIKIKIFKLRK